MKTLPTWGEKSSFQYTGSVAEGTTIHYGTDYAHVASVSADEYAALLTQFCGRTANMGTSRDKAPAGSVGAWLQEHVNPTGLASYVGAILVDEGYAERAGGPNIRFFD